MHYSILESCLSFDLTVFSNHWKKSQITTQQANTFIISRGIWIFAPKLQIRICSLILRAKPQIWIWITKDTDVEHVGVKIEMRHFLAIFTHYACVRSPRSESFRKTSHWLFLQLWLLKILSKLHIFYQKSLQLTSKLKIKKV